MYILKWGKKLIRLQDRDIYLATLEREDCRKIWEDFEYDFTNPGEHLNIGFSLERSDDWFDEIQKHQGNQSVRLGVFLHDGTVIGDAALQDINHTNRSCTIGMGISKLMHRSKGYGKQAVKIMLRYGFYYLGMERISANTLEHNIAAQLCLEKIGFVLEGKERKAAFINGRRYDRVCYGLLKEEFQVLNEKRRF